MIRLAVLAALAVSVLAGTVAASTCDDDRLAAIAATRLARLEACDCLTHAGFDEAVAGLPGWHSELVAQSSERLTLELATPLWLSSPEHRAAYEHPRTAQGFAASDEPTAGGHYFAVLILEEKP